MQISRSQLRQRLRFYGRLSEQKRRYAAPEVPDGEVPVNPKQVAPEKFTVRVAKRLGKDKFALFHFVPAKVERKRGFGRQGNAVDWMWSYLHPPKVVNAEHLRRVGVDADNGGPRLFSLVHPSIVEKLEGVRRVPSPVVPKQPAGRLVPPPPTKFNR